MPSDQDRRGNGCKTNVLEVQHAVPMMIFLLLLLLSVCVVNKVKPVRDFACGVPTVSRPPFDPSSALSLLLKIGSRRLTSKA